MKRLFLLACVTLLAAATAHADALPGSPAAVIAGELDAALTSRGMTGPHQVELDNALLSLPRGVTAPSLQIVDLSVDERSGRLTADLVPPGSRLHLRVGGRVYQMVDAVVPTHPIDPGEVIHADDLHHATVRYDPAQRQFPLRDDAALLDHTPRHPLSPGAPVYAADLRVPIVIHRGDLVTMSVATPLMMVAAQGKALENATRGGAVRVSNTKSNRVIEGVAAGPGRVIVSGPFAR